MPRSAFETAQACSASRGLLEAVGVEARYAASVVEVDPSYLEAAA